MNGFFVLRRASDPKPCGFLRMLPSGASFVPAVFCQFLRSCGAQSCPSLGSSRPSQSHTHLSRTERPSSARDDQDPQRSLLLEPVEHLQVPTMSARFNRSFTGFRTLHRSASSVSVMALSASGRFKRSWRTLGAGYETTRCGPTGGCLGVAMASVSVLASAARCASEEDKRTRPSDGCPTSNRVRRASRVKVNLASSDKFEGLRARFELAQKAENEGKKVGKQRPQDRGCEGQDEDEGARVQSAVYRQHK